MQPLYFLVAALGVVIAVLGLQIALQGRSDIGMSATGTGGTGVPIRQISQSGSCRRHNGDLDWFTLLLLAIDDQDRDTDHARFRWKLYDRSVYARLGTECRLATIGPWAATDEWGTRMDLHSDERGTASLQWSGRGTGMVVRASFTS